MLDLHSSINCGDNFDFFPIQNERIALMVGGIAHLCLGG